VDKCRNDVVGVFPNAVELLRLASSSGSHTNSDTPVSSVQYSSRHLSYLLNQRNVLCLDRNQFGIIAGAENQPWPGGLAEGQPEP
jgi:hypothetical protein